MIEEPDVHEMLGKINQLLIDLSNVEDERHRRVIKSFIQLKIKYLSGLVKDL